MIKTEIPSQYCDSVNLKNFLERFRFNDKRPYKHPLVFFYTFRVSFFKRLNRKQYDLKCCLIDLATVNFSSFFSSFYMCWFTFLGNLRFTSSYLNDKNWNIKDTQTFSNHHVQCFGTVEKQDEKLFSFSICKYFLFYSKKKMFYTICHFFIADYVFGIKASRDIPSRHKRKIW